MRKREMTKEEFLNRVKKYGIELNRGDLQMIVGSYVPVSYYLGIYKKGDTWIIYETFDRNQVVGLYRYQDENKAFDQFYDLLMTRLLLAGYINNVISRHTIEVPKTAIYQYFHNKGGILKIDFEKAWTELIFDLHVLNELKYYVRFAKFVPEDNCYKVQGYSAQDVHNLLGLNIFNSFVYLIKLEKDDTNEYLTRLESAKAND